MYTYTEQIEIIDKISVREGCGINVNCPFCGGRKTLGVAVRQGKKLWHCFKVSCGIRGTRSVGMSTGALRKRLHGVEASKRTKRLAEVPALVSDPSFHPAVLKYLEDNNCIEAYHGGLIRVEYAPAEHRVLFFSNDEKGAVGRTMDGAIPKWKQYGNIEGVVKVGTGDVGVIVEDVPSACSISRLQGFIGCALLGTVLSNVQKAQLNHFKEVVVALDKDASRKAIELSRRLEGRVKCRVILLEEDAKHMTVGSLRSLLAY
jgi:hypothetical protein